MNGLSGSSQHLVQRLLQSRHGAVDITQFVQPEQADAEGLEVCRLVALQRHASGDLQAERGELGAALDLRVVGVADHHARRLKTRRRHALEDILDYVQEGDTQYRPPSSPGDRLGMIKHTGRTIRCMFFWRGKGLSIAGREGYL